MSLPVLLFCAVFATALGVSRIAILPALTAVEVGGVVRDASGLKSHAEELQATLALLQEDREEEVLPQGGTVYRSLVDTKIGSPSVTELLQIFRTIAQSVVPQANKAISITGVHHDALKKSLTLSGDVSGAGPGSMTVLAQFTEILRDDPHVRSLVAPTFSRLEDPRIGPHSPFTIVLTLQ